MAFYTYAYLDPRKPAAHGFDHTPFYIGAGNSNRDQFHLEEAKITATMNLKLNTIRKLWRLGLEPIIVRIKEFEDDDFDSAFALEVELIKQIGTVKTIDGVPNGPLANLTSGGEGGFGRYATQADEVLKKLSDARRDGKWMTKDGVQKYVKKDFETMEAAGWTYGFKESEKRTKYLQKLKDNHPSKELTWVNNGKQNKRVLDPSTWIVNGWVLGWLCGKAGQHNTSYMWITDGASNKKIKKNDPIPEGWKQGRFRPSYPDGYKKT